MKLKKVLAAVLAGTMVMASVSTAFAATSIADLECGTADDGTTWWIAHTEGIELKEGTTTFTFTNTSTGSSNWNSGIYVIYTADEAYDGGEDGISATSGYTEYYVCRSDVYGWDGAGAVSATTLTVDSSPADGLEDQTDIDAAWADWLAECQAGIDSTIVATLSGDTLTVVFTVGDAQTTATIAVDSSVATYLSLTGELCTLSDISYEYEETSSNTAGTTNTTSESSESSEAATTTQKTTQAGDAAPVAAVAVALLGCAAIAFASKKKMA